MTESNLPSEVSTADLQALLSNALSEDECHTPKELKGDDLFEAAREVCNTAVAQHNCDAAVMHKAMVINIINHMIEWHTQMANRLIDEGHTDAAIGWARDAGKLQSVCNVLTTISLGEDDFMCAQ